MKTLWVAVVLSFVSVGQPAPLTCDKLAKPVEKRPDLSGRWHYTAVSTEVCLPALLVNNLFWPSLAIDVTYKGTPNLYTATVKSKMFGFCLNETEDFFQENNKLFEVNSENNPVGDPDILLQTSCSDCIVVKSNDTLSTVSLLSRRKTITEEELKEFEMQAQCVRFSKPQVLNADHDYDNCQDLEDITEDQSRTFLLQMIERKKQVAADDDFNYNLYFFYNAKALLFSFQQNPDNLDTLPWSLGKCQGIRGHKTQTSPEQQQKTEMWISLQICCKADCYRTSFLPKTIRINDNSEKSLSYGLKQ